MGRRKSDDGRMKENRGVGRGIFYRPWLKPHELSSDGLSTRLRGWIINRMYCFLSKLERGYFLLTQWEYKKVVDIREQYPLLPLEETIQIANDLGFKHIPANAPKGQETVMTTDFVITIKKGSEKYDIARTVKPKSRLTERVKQKFMIEQEYWKRRNVDWGVVTESEIDPIMVANIEFLYTSYFWDETIGLSSQEVDDCINEYKATLIKNNFDVVKTNNEFDIEKGWRPGESLNFFKYLITKKIIKVGMKKNIREFYKKDYKITF